jgi:hypothetical protein
MIKCGSDLCVSNNANFNNKCPYSKIYVKKTCNSLAGEADSTIAVETTYKKANIV